jgi:hypothetical protein
LSNVKHVGQEDIGKIKLFGQKLEYEQQKLKDKERQDAIDLLANVTSITSRQLAMVETSPNTPDYVPILNVHLQVYSPGINFQKTHPRQLKFSLTKQIHTDCTMRICLQPKIMLVSNQIFFKSYKHVYKNIILKKKMS